MGILGELGVPTSSIPKIDVTGLFSNTWMWVLLVVIVGMILTIGIVLLLFFMTYKKKVILFENISGQGYQPILKTRARVIKLGIGGEEILKTDQNNCVIIHPVKSKLYTEEEVIQIIYNSSYVLSNGDTTKGHADNWIKENLK